MSLLKMDCLFALAEGAGKKGVGVVVLTAHPTTHILYVIAADIISSWHGV